MQGTEGASGRSESDTCECLAKGAEQVPSGMIPEDREDSSIELRVEVLALASSRARFYLTRCQPLVPLSKCSVDNFDLCALPRRTFSGTYRIPRFRTWISVGHRYREDT